MMLKVAAHTDVISQDFEHALDVAQELGIEHIDLRDLWNKNIIDLSDSEVRDVRSSVTRHGLKVCSLSPYLFFLPLREREGEVTHRGSHSEHVDRLKRAVELAKVFDTNLVKCWSFIKDDQFIRFPSYFVQPFSVREKIIERFQKPMQIAEEAGVILAMESCHHSNTGTGIQVCQLIDELGSKNVKLLWDPCNSFYASGQDPYPYEYEQVKEYIVAVDVKDKIIDTRTGRYEHTVMGNGNKIYWPEILQRLLKDNYQGPLVLESEYAPKGGTVEDGTRESLKRLREMMSSLE